MNAWDSKSALRWDCTKKGCHNVKGRPKLLAFSDCFPGRISPSDIDFVVEINGHFLFVEWKGVNVPVSIAQEILHKNLTRESSRIVSVVVEGDPETMAVSSIRVIRGGKVGPSEAATLETLPNIPPSRLLAPPRIEPTMSSRYASSAGNRANRTASQLASRTPTISGSPPLRALPQSSAATFGLPVRRLL